MIYPWHLDLLKTLDGVKKGELMVMYAGRQSGKSAFSREWDNNRDRTRELQQAIADMYFQHHNPYTHKPVRNKYNVIGDRVEEMREMIVHTFTMGDVEDPDLYAAEPLMEWQNSEFGQWVMKNACDVPTWHRYADHMTYGYKYAITAKFIGAALTEMLLRKT